MSASTDVLLLRLDAPLMSFGAPVVDEQGKINPYPAQSLITGLVANALGFDRTESEKLEDLQNRTQYAVRQDKAGQKITDFQTVDLTTSHMSSYVWTTSGRKKRRTGKDREILHREYWADAVYTVAYVLDPPDKSPTLDDVKNAIKHPARPLFIGRKPCLPAASLFEEHSQVSAARIQDALLHGLADADTLPKCAKQKDDYAVWWPTHPNVPRPQDRDFQKPVVESIRKPVTDQRDWENQIHTGERWIAHGTLSID
jgi:CRISPR system Cascade subunit CasD